MITFVFIFFLLGTHPPLEDATNYASEEFMRAYISLARNFVPVVPEDLTDFIVDSYVNMRSEEVSMKDQAYSYTTARTLQAILRMSQALVSPSTLLNFFSYEVLHLTEYLYVREGSNPFLKWGDQGGCGRGYAIDA